MRLVVPQREHCLFEGWYADKECTRQVADKTGKIVIGNELFEIEEDTLTAKWAAEEKLTYKILMVYVTRFQAVLPTIDNTKEITIDYEMSELERRICQKLTIQFERYLDSLDIADFVVDEEIIYGEQ